METDAWQNFSNQSTQILYKYLVISLFVNFKKQTLKKANKR